MSPILQPSNDPQDPGPGGFGPVPTIGGNVSTSVPDPVTGSSATQEQQATTATTQAISQRIFMPPAPSWNQVVTASGMLTAPWVTYFQLLTRKLGGYTATPEQDSVLLNDSDPVVDGYARQRLDDQSLEDSSSCHCGRVEKLVQDYLLLADPAPVKDHLTTWNDWNASISGAKVPAANAPTWNALVGNLYAYQFAVNDYIYMEAQEFLHDWKEGTDVQVHIHWATGGLNDATVRGVKWEVEYSVCNPVEGAFGATAYTGTTTASQEFSIPAAQPDRTHRVGTIATISGANLRIGAQIVMRLRRIAAAATAPAANPFGISFGLHYESDTPGSRSVFTK